MALMLKQDVLQMSAFLFIGCEIIKSDPEFPADIIHRAKAVCQKAGIFISAYAYTSCYKNPAVRFCQVTKAFEGIRKNQDLELALYVLQGEEGHLLFLFCHLQLALKHDSPADSGVALLQPAHTGRFIRTVII